MSVVNRDFDVCYAVDGGLLNLVATVNALPSDYCGRFQALLNNVKHITSARDAAILHCLLDPTLDLEQAAELCTHLLYFSSLTPAQASVLRSHFESLSDSIGNTQSSQQDFHGGNLRVWHHALEPLKDLMNSTYTQEQAQKNMHKATYWDGQTQYLEPRIWSLKPSHRLASIKLRKVGVLLPFAVPTDAFTEPNRLMFDKDGKWINASVLRPYVTWDMREVLPSGAKHGCHEDDLAGCLFFHSKDQLAEFARRARAWGVRVYLTHLDTGELYQQLASADPAFAPFALGRFDRVDLPHLVDQLPDKRDVVFEHFGALLNRANPHATLLVRTIEWRYLYSDQMRLGRPGARAGASAGPPDPVHIEALVRSASAYLNFDPDNLERRMEQVLMLHLLDAWSDNQPVFEEYLQETRMKGILEDCGLRIKTRNTLVPPRLDWLLSGKPETLPGLSKHDWYLLGAGSDAPLICGG
ncbi:uncharacterized protein PHACADRAFT_167911 [Phanerochaete carnosa HHB-10118-sp]|uniref:DUF4470 domain-containing protein n=1 Tax=Phanerochaete carnosa (strain HHB-10118-sp) TaxID=650164 RepID=K5W9D3_PHACS|nr:uncharacterized protein PHACADRAFT_167911 [Phanerochaete carnosa HHB-10118-sp]EKM60568.1 hypothetical protein PHACADRAFT_167911 [Phanerochaete carnosa HHB-10118-sp]